MQVEERLWYGALQLVDGEVDGVEAGIVRPERRKAALEVIVAKIDVCKRRGACKRVGWSR